MGVLMQTLTKKTMAYKTLEDTIGNTPLAQ